METLFKRVYILRHRQRYKPGYYLYIFLLFYKGRIFLRTDSVFIVNSWPIATFIAFTIERNRSRNIILVMFTINVYTVIKVTSRSHYGIITKQTELAIRYAGAGSCIIFFPCSTVTHHIRFIELPIRHRQVLHLMLAM